MQPGGRPALGPQPASGQPTDNLRDSRAQQIGASTLDNLPRSQVAIHQSASGPGSRPWFAASELTWCPAVSSSPASSQLVAPSHTIFSQSGSHAQSDFKFSYGTTVGSQVVNPVPSSLAPGPWRAASRHPDHLHDKQRSGQPSGSPVVIPLGSPVASLQLYRLDSLPVDHLQLAHSYGQPSGQPSGLPSGLSSGQPVDAYWTTYLAAVRVPSAQPTGVRQGAQGSYCDPFSGNSQAGLLQPSGQPTGFIGTTSANRQVYLLGSLPPKPRSHQASLVVDRLRSLARSRQQSPQQPTGSVRTASGQPAV